MIELTKLSGDTILMNEDQIECVSFIPETKIVLMNGEYVLVRDKKEDLIQKIIDFKRQIKWEV